MGQYPTFEEIDKALIDQLHDLVLFFHPEAKQRGNALKWGGKRNDVNSVVVTGPRIGTFSNWNDDVHGGPRALVAYELGLQMPADWKRVSDWARDWLGWTGANGQSEQNKEQLEARRRQAAELQRQRERELLAEEEERRDFARAQWDAAEPCSTRHPYLRHGRGIKLRRMPDVVRLSQRAARSQKGRARTGPAITCVIQGPRATRSGRWRDNTFLGVQHIFLDPSDHTRKRDMGDQSAKITHGVQAGGAIRFTEAAEVLRVTEGPENGLSLVSAFPEWAVWAATGTSVLGSMFLPPECTTVVIFGDWDREHERKDGSKYRPGPQAAEKLAQRAREDGKFAIIVYPPIADDPDEQMDWNDLLHHDPEHFRATVEALIAEAGAPEEPIDLEQPEDAPHDPVGVREDMPEFVAPEPVSGLDTTNLGALKLDYNNAPDFWRYIQGRWIWCLETKGLFDTKLRQGTTKQAMAALDKFLPELKRAALGQSDKKITTVYDLLRTDSATMIADGISYDPGRPDQEYILEGIGAERKTCFNMYRTAPVIRTQGGVDMFVQHVQNIFDQDEAMVDQFMCWLAIQIQRPGVKVQWAPLLQGGQGVGKSYFPNEVMKPILGYWNVVIVGPEQLGERFNRYAMAKQLLVVDELTQKSIDQQQVEAKLKMMVSEPNLGIRMMNHDWVYYPNRMNVMLISNQSSPINIDPDDRRYFVHFSDFRPPNPEYMEDLVSWTREHVSDIAGYLGGYYIEEFDPHKPAMITQARRELIVESLDAVTYEIRNMIREEAWCFQADLTTTRLIQRCMGYPYKGYRSAQVRQINRAMERLGFDRIKKVRVPKEICAADNDGRSHWMGHDAGSKPDVWVVRNHARWINGELKDEQATDIFRYLDRAVKPGAWDYQPTMM